MSLLKEADSSIAKWQRLYRDEVERNRSMVCMSSLRMDLSVGYFIGSSRVLHIIFSTE